MLRTESYRTENDSLGAKQVPASAYYGIQTLRAVENFPITGQKLDRDFILSIVRIKKSAARANLAAGKLDADAAGAIIEAANEMIRGKWLEHVIVDPIQGGAGTSINMNINEVIANRALELRGEKKGSYSVLSPNTHVNMSQSTNDVIPTAANVALLIKVNRLLSTLTDLEKGFQAKAVEFDSVIKMGRTHLQDAVPIRLGQEFAAYRNVIRRDIQRIQTSKQPFHIVNLGATAVGTGLNADFHYTRHVIRFLSQETGFSLNGAEDYVDWTQNTDRYTQLSAALKVCMTNLSKICNDLRLMASGPRTGLGEIRLPARQPGSSIMPGKVNPVMCEVVNQVAFQVFGNDETVHRAAEAGQFELNVMQPVILMNLFQSIEMMHRALEVFNRYCLKGIRANPTQCRKYADSSIGLLTVLLPLIGYEKAAQLAFEALESEKDAREVCEQELGCTREEMERLLDPYAMTGDSNMFSEA